MREFDIGTLELHSPHLHSTLRHSVEMLNSSWRLETPGFSDVKWCSISVKRGISDLQMSLVGHVSMLSGVFCHVKTCDEVETTRHWEGTWYRQCQWRRLVPLASVIALICRLVCMYTPQLPHVSQRTTPFMAFFPQLHGIPVPSSSGPVNGQARNCGEPPARLVGPSFLAECRLW